MSSPNSTQLTTAAADAASDPFQDPANPSTSPSPSDLDPNAVLTVDRNATLTLGTDALIVLDEGLIHRRHAGNFCGLLPQLSKTTRAIPFYNVLWAELREFDVEIKYAAPAGEKGCTVGAIAYTVTDKALHGHAKRWVEGLMARAYPPGTRRRKRIKVLVNPFGGQGHAVKLWTRQVEPIFAAAKCDVDVEKTAYRGHAVEIAEHLDVGAWDVVACASGDGLPHEVFNGLARQKHPREALRKVAVVQLPCGTGNAMSLNLNGTDSPSLAAVAVVKGVRTPLDLVAITQGEERYYSFLSQAVGIIAESDLGTESLRWMGALRFTWGLLVRLLGKTVYPAEISFALETEDKRVIREKFRQKRDETDAEASKQQSRMADDDSDSDDDAPAQGASDGDALPILRYGTVTSPMPSDFQTHDLPTLGNFYTGNMAFMSPNTPFFPCAQPSDGRADLITIDGLVPRLTALRMLTTVENGNLMDFPEVAYRKVSGYRIVPRVAPKEGKGWKKRVGKWMAGSGGDGGKWGVGYIAVDGERVPFQPFQAEVQRGLGTVLSRRRGRFEFEGPGGGSA